MITNGYTDLELQLALAKELPEEIIINNGGQFYWRARNSETCIRPLVTPREWDWIVRECEKKLDESQWHVYDENVCELYITGVTQIFMLLHAPWQTRAIAYFKTIGKEFK